MTVYIRQIVPNPDILEKEKSRPLDHLNEKHLGELDENLNVILNKGLSFADNFDGIFVTFSSSATPDAENTVAHELGKIPTGFIVTSLDKGAVVYKGPTAFTDSNIYLKVNTASVAVTVFIF